MEVPFPFVGDEMVPLMGVGTEDTLKVPFPTAPVWRNNLKMARATCFIRHVKN